MWARITIFLAAALLVAVAAGTWFGYMLAANAPQSPVEPRAQASLPVTGNDAAPIIPEPPQPLMDGTLGVPQRGPVLNEGEVPLVSALDDETPDIALDTAGQNEHERDSGLDEFIASLNARDAMRSMGDAPNAAEAGVPQPETRQRELPPDLAFAIARPAEEAPAWLNALRASLGRCSTQRFFNPAECEQRLRIQYCDPNGGWGSVPECPAAQRNIRY